MQCAPRMIPRPTHFNTVYYMKKLASELYIKILFDCLDDYNFEVSEMEELEMELTVEVCIPACGPGA